MVVKIHGYARCPPVRSVIMAARTMDIDVELVSVDLSTFDHLQPNYLKINLQHTVPVLEDDGHYLAESRAILQYLANAYTKDASYYPKDFKARSKVDELLSFDGTSLYKNFAEAYYVIFLEKKRPVEARLKKFDVSLGFLNDYLERSKFSASDNFTIADFTIYSTLMSAAAVGHDISKFSNVEAYLERCKAVIPSDVHCDQGLKDFGVFIQTSLEDITD